MKLVCFVEEPSAKIMLDIILPKILPTEFSHYCFPFQGKQDLEKNIELKLKNWNVPDTKFLIMRDKDSGNCKEIKQNLLEKIQNSGKENSSLVRIACHELESFYLGDLSAVGDAFNLNNISKNQDKKKYRNPDNLTNAKEELKKVINNYAEISGSKAISPFLKLDNSNKSVSFNFLISGIQKLCNT